MASPGLYLQMKRRRLDTFEGLMDNYDLMDRRYEEEALRKIDDQTEEKKDETQQRSRTD